MLAAKLALQYQIVLCHLQITAQYTLLETHELNTCGLEVV